MNPSTKLYSGILVLTKTNRLANIIISTIPGISVNIRFFFRKTLQFYVTIQNSISMSIKCKTTPPLELMFRLCQMQTQIQDFFVKFENFLSLANNV